MVSLKKNLLYNFLLSVSQVAFPLISIPYISRVLDPSGIGQVSFIDSLTYYFIAIAEFGIVVYGIRETSRKKDDPPALNKLVSELLSLHIITSSVSLIIYSIVVYTIYEKINDPRLILFSMSFLLLNFFASEWYYLGREKFKFIALRSIIARSLGLISIFLLVKQPQDYYLYYAIIVSTSIIILVWNALILFKETNISFRNINWKQHVRSTWIMYQISLYNGVIILLDIVLLGLISSAIAVAFYAFAIKIVRISGALITDMISVFYPRTISLIYQQDHSQLQKIIFYASDLILLTTIPMGIGIYFLADSIALVYLGNSFLPVAINLKILCFYPLLKSFSLFLTKQILTAFDMEKLVAKILLISAIIFIICTCILTYFFADNGTSVAIMISELIIILISIYFVKYLKNSIEFFNFYPLKQALIGSLCFIPIIYLVDYLVANLFLRLTIQIFLCVLVYFYILIYFFKNSLLIKIFNSFKAS